MPTLVWRRRPESGTDAAREGSATRREALVPDPVVFAAAVAVPNPVVSASAAPDPAHVALPAVSSKRHAIDGKKKKRKVNRAEAATAATKKPKAKPERDLPTGVRGLSSRNFQSQINWDGKNRHIGTFDTPEQASAAYELVRNDLDDAKLSGFGADEVGGIFDAAQKKAVEAVGGFFTRDLPKGVYKTTSGKKLKSSIKWSGKQRYIGSFDTPEQASAAHVSMRKERDNVELLILSADEVNAAFDAARKKAVEAVGGFISRKRAKTSERVLPQGVYKKSSSGRFESKIKRGGKQRYIGSFDPLEQASAAYMSVKKDLDDVKLSGFGADEVDDVFDAAKKKALERSR